MATKKKKEKYDWLQESLTLEKQREILEKRREYLLQLMPDDVIVNPGSTDRNLLEEWHALQLHRDKLLHSLIDKENVQSLDHCYVNLLHTLTTIGSYDHSSTPQPLKQALFALYWQIKKYFKDVDVTALQFDTSKSLCSSSLCSSPQKRKKRKTKLNKPDLIPSIHLNLDSPLDDGQAYKSPKRYKPDAPPHAALSSERVALLVKDSSVSEWESTDESLCGDDVTDLNTSACSIDVTPGQGRETRRLKAMEQDASGTPSNHVSFTSGIEGAMVTPKSARAPRFGRTPVSTRTPLIRGLLSHTHAPPSGKSKQRAALGRRYNKGSPLRRRSPHKAPSRRNTPTVPRGTTVRVSSTDIHNRVTTSTATGGSGDSTSTNDDIETSDVSTDVKKTSDITSDVMKTCDVMKTSDVSSDVRKTSDVSSDVRKTSDVSSDVRKTSDVTSYVSTDTYDDVEFDMYEDSQHDVTITDETNAEHDHVDDVTEAITEYYREEELKRPVPDEHDLAVARALQKTFQNYKRGGVYTSPVRANSTTDEREESFNISID